MTTVAAKFDAALGDISKIVTTSKKLLLAESPDALIRSNVNFFTKAYLIMICVYLESYVKEVAVAYITHFNAEMGKIGVPRNLIAWSVDPKGAKNIVQKYVPFTIDIDQKNIDDAVSPNPHLIAGLFKMMGVDIENDRALNSMKGVVYPIVEKRNRIVHYNDSASDITFDDILRDIKEFKKYIRLLDKNVEAVLLPRGVNL